MTAVNRAGKGILREKARAVAGQIVAKQAGRLRPGLTQVSFRMVEGDPKQIIVDQSEKWKAGCIFVGARGLSPERRFLLGGVSMSVAARASCAVEVVR